MRADREHLADLEQRARDARWSAYRDDTATSRAWARDREAEYREAEMGDDVDD
jgi:hypothetical protein